MNCDMDFKEWLSRFRFSRRVCMMIPMEAGMGFPVVVKQGSEYIIPFFRVPSAEKNDALTPPFAYLRVSYPSATILTYNNLRTLPEWKDIDLNSVTERNESSTDAQQLKKYYNAIACYETVLSFDEQDKLLLACFSSQSEDTGKDSDLVVWYKKLIEEAKKYR